MKNKQATGRLHLFEERSTPKRFHYVLGGGTVRTGRESTMCDVPTTSMRKAAPFKPGDVRGDVHLRFACDVCVSELDRMEV